MKTYVTFGFDHKHVIDEKEIDKDCVAVISCADAAEGRKIAFELFGRKFCFEYPEDHFDAGYKRAIDDALVAINSLRREWTGDIGRGALHRAECAVAKLLDAQRGYKHEELSR